jgi:Pyruvate/2-oxoacid:ferredoxin oxidoreductase delta subunit
VSFRNGINTLSDRGWSRPLTRDEAKAVVERASAEGLVHTLNDSGLCNCCSDCCYLYRAQRARGQGLVWPAAAQIAALSTDECIGCDVCVTRCPFGAFASSGDAVVFDASRCRGCGLCAETCPTDAISMNRRVHP